MNTKLEQAIVWQELLVEKLTKRIGDTEKHLAFLEHEAEEHGIDNEPLILEMKEEIQEMQEFLKITQRALDCMKEVTA